MAWREMVRNSAHDSICACSVDDVVDAVLHRYAEARTIADGLADRAVKSFARSLAEPGPSVLNPSSRARAGVVELVVAADGPAPDDVQVLSERSGLPGSMVLDADTVRTVLGMLQGPEISDDAWIHDVVIVENDEGIDVTITVGTGGEAERPDRRGQTGSLHQARGPARRGRPRRHGPALDPAHRRPDRRGPGLRVAARSPRRR